MTGSNDDYGEGSYETSNNGVIDFTTRCQEKTLSPLRLVENPMRDISTTLGDYFSVLNRGCSIALNRGENLASIRLAKSLESLFSTAAPQVTEGPSLSWTMLILSVGPHFDSPAQLKIGGSHVDLPEDDFELIRSGRPWRFLCPWPDKDDCKSEIQSTELALRELIDTRQMINKVLEEVSLVEQHLKIRHNMVSQVYMNADRTVTQEPPGHEGIQGRLPIESDFDASIFRGDEGNDHQNPPPTTANIHVPADDQTNQPITPAVQPNNSLLQTFKSRLDHLNEISRLSSESDHPRSSAAASPLDQAQTTWVPVDVSPTMEPAVSAIERQEAEVRSEEQVHDARGGGSEANSVPRSLRNSSSKRQVIRWSPEEEERLLEWMNAWGSLSWAQTEQRYYQDFGLKRKQQSIQGKMYQLIRRRKSEKAFKQRNRSTTPELAARRSSQRPITPSCRYLRSASRIREQDEGQHFTEQSATEAVLGNPASMSANPQMQGMEGGQLGYYQRLSIRSILH